MLVRKRPRPRMRRTSSMKEFASETEATWPSNPANAVDSHSLQALLLFEQLPNQRRTSQVDAAAGQCKVHDWPAGRRVWLEAGLYAESVVPPEGCGAVRSRNSGDFAVLEAAPFLMACGLCNRRLGPGRDTFMYRGETAFCSLECRQQHINQVELKEKCSLSSVKDTPQVTNSSDKSDDAETAAAS